MAAIGENPMAIDKQASYLNHVTYTGDSTFAETGTISFGDADGELDIVTVGEGTLGPSADANLLHGAVICHLSHHQRSREIRGRERFDHLQFPPSTRNG
jgi:hypothetical protein